MKLFLCVGLGGFIGAVSRYYLSTTIDRWQNTGFPWGILCANVLGCLIIGIMFGVTEHVRLLSEELRLFLITGFLGSLTTFSTFSHDTYDFLRKGQMLMGLSNIGLSVLFGLTAVWLGYQVALLGAKAS